MKNIDSQYAAKCAEELDDWVKGAIFGFVTGVLTPFLLYWAFSGPIK